VRKECDVIVFVGADGLNTCFPPILGVSRTILIEQLSSVGIAAQVATQVVMLSMSFSLTLTMRQNYYQLERTSSKSCQSASSLPSGELRTLRDPSIRTFLENACSAQGQWPCLKQSQFRGPQ
jgi:hypothetical protein